MEEISTSCERCNAPRTLPVNAGWRGEWRCDCGHPNQITAFADRPVFAEDRAERARAAKVRSRAMEAIEQFQKKEARA
jgi:hypothetical protein